MIRNDEQRAEICDALVKPLHHKGIRWTANGCSLKAGARPGLSSGELILYQAAWAFWNSSSPHGKKSALGDVYFRIDAPRQRMIGELLIAYSEGPNALDAWLAVYGTGAANE
jgi:hypothetical protein